MLWVNSFPLIKIVSTCACLEQKCLRQTTSFSFKRDVSTSQREGDNSNNLFPFDKNLKIFVFIIFKYNS